MRLNSEKGQATVEFALVLPLLLLLLCGIIDFGWIFGNKLLAENAVREAARYTAIHYNDSDTDDDSAAAAEIVSNRAQNLSGAIVTLSVSGDEITVNVSSSVSVPTPIIASFFPDGECAITASCTMRME